MTTNPRSQTHLAELLGVSKAQVSRNAARGMPTATLEAARAWRSKHLNIAQRSRPIPDQGNTAQKATRLMERASSALDSGGSIDAMIPTLRAALAAVPRPDRDAVGLPLAVIKVLVAHVLDNLPPRELDPLDDDGVPLYSRGDMSDEDAQTAGEVWYEIAAGEVLCG